MTVIGISLAKNNADIIRVSTEHMINQVDHVIVMDNNSTDGAREILGELPITVIDDPEVGYYQSRKMTALAKVARNMGADWVIPFDSDEIWYSPFGTIKEVLDGLGPQWLIATADLYDHVTSTADPEEENPVKRIGWRRSYKGVLPKVACRWREDLVIEQGNHSAGYHGGPTRQDGLLVVRHYPYRSTEQFIRKVRDGVVAYAATDLPETSGAHWKDYGRLLAAYGEPGLEEVYYTWFHLNQPEALDAVIYDPAPIVL
jgi:glycosyltransferase involved in cell wall biosynthesis